MTTISIFRELIRSKNYVVSHHAADELEDDDLTILDLESIVLTGQIVERQHDGETDETKRVVNGRSIADDEAEVVVKIGFNGELIFITVYVI
ncbi:DUF4258 domain-containing protein [uncultured Lamprocystis sp.]|uniref:DUF4258 domain-containing protein n=1 Tax=uncultured Lamprocystis sp. TaxID=543132 RepID=UPI0025F2EAED|nr:DUF4258 domain-containing protein [uncultured Lamprocystis sp.]